MAFAAFFVLQTSAEDYSIAFENLRKLGLPDTANSNYAMLKPVEEQYNNWGRNAYSLFPQLYDVKFSGNAWILSENREANTFVAVVGGTKLAEFSKTPGNTSKLPAATWESRDLTPDVKLLKSRFKDSEFSDSLQYDPSFGGAVLIFAAHIDRMGSKTQAAELVQLCLESVPNPEKAIQSAIEQIANGKYQVALAEVYRSGDWKAFATQCRNIAGTFGTGWSASRAALVLAERAGSQPGDLPPLVPPPGIELSEEDLALAKALGALENPELLDRFRYAGPWIFAERNVFERYGPLANPGSQSLLDTLLERRKSAIPVLISMLGDTNLLSFDRPTSQEFSDDLDKSLQESGNDNWRQFPRPATRADLAAILLLPLIPNVDTYETGMAEFADIARGWWNEVKAKSEIDLAREYLRTPNQETFGAVAAYMASHGSDEDFPKVEELLIAQLFSSTWPNYAPVTTYVQARGNEAKPLIETIEKKIEETENQLVEAEDPELEQFRQRHEQSLKMLKSLVSNETLEDILLRVSSGEEDINTIRQTLASKSQTTPPQESIEAFAKAANATDDPMTRAQLLTWASYFSRSKDSDAIPLTRKEEWKRLLSDNRNPQNNTPVGVSAAWLVESVYAPESAADLELFGRKAGKAGWDFIRSRAQARVDGSEIPPFPKASDVSETRAAELRSQLLGLSGNRSELRDTVAGLSLAEQLWTVGDPAPPQIQTGGFGQEEVNDEEVKPKDEVALTIESAQFEISQVEAAETWKGKLPSAGETFSPETFDTLLKGGLDFVQGGGTFSLEIRQTGPLGPLTISIETPEKEELLAEKEVTNSFNRLSHMFQEPTPLVAATWGTQQFQAFWFPPEEKDESASDAPSSQNNFRSYMEEAGEQARNGLPAWLSAPTAYARPLHIRMIGFTHEPPKEDE